MWIKLAQNVQLYIFEIDSYCFLWRVAMNLTAIWVVLPDSLRTYGIGSGRWINFPATAYTERVGLNWSDNGGIARGIFYRIGWQDSLYKEGGSVGNVLHLGGQQRDDVGRGFGNCSSASGQWQVNGIYNRQRQWKLDCSLINLDFFPSWLRYWENEKLHVGSNVSKYCAIGLCNAKSRLQ